jgi:hypothetical protein
MPSNPIQYEEEAGRLRISWSNRRARKDWFVFIVLLLFWIVWFPSTLVGTVGIFVSTDPVFFTIWSIFAWVGAIAIPWSFVAMFWFEWIEIDAKAISYGASGWLASKPSTLSLDQILEFTLGYFSNRDDHESMVTLNVYEKGVIFDYRRHLIGYWLAEKHKEEIFERIQEFVVRQSLPLQVTVYGQGRLAVTNHPS